MATVNERKYLHFLESELKPVPPEQALFHIIPAPYEKSVSYGRGTAAGPAAILEASLQLELFDGVGIPADHGIYTYPPLSCAGDPEWVLKAISDSVSNVLQLGRVPVLIGGEHTITVGAIEALKKHRGNFGVVQFDAHADLRDSFEGNRLSHACVMHRVLDHDLPLFQIGVRSLSLEEELLSRKMDIGRLDASVIASRGIPDKILPAGFPADIYLTIDVDVFDPAVVPATGTPEPGGLFWYQMLRALEAVLKDRRVIGFDVVELAPVAGLHASDYTVARLIYTLFGMIGRSRGRLQ